MTSYKELRKRATKLGLNLWENGGYYYLSGVIRGHHRQGIFDTLKQVEAQLSDESRYQKAKESPVEKLHRIKGIDGNTYIY